MTEYLDMGRKSLHAIGMNVSMPETQFMDFAFKQNEHGNQGPMNITREKLERVSHFEYLGMNTEYEDGMETNITVRVGPGWINWINAAVYCAEGEG